MLCGHTPFESSNQQRVFERIVHSQKHLSFPRNFDPHGKSLIRKLLHPNAALRLGALQNGINDIKSHAFFTTQALDFELLLNEELEMPYIPPNFEIGQIVTNAEIEPLDLDMELCVTEDDDVDGFFAGLTNPDLTNE